MWGSPGLSTCPLLSLLYINDFNKASSVLDLHLFANDSNLFFSHKNLQTLESIVNNELSNIHEWICANRLSLNTDKTNYVLFHTVQKHITDCFSLKLNSKQISKKMYKVLRSSNRFTLIMERTHSELV